MRTDDYDGFTERQEDRETELMKEFFELEKLKHDDPEFDRRPEAPHLRRRGSTLYNTQREVSKDSTERD